MVTASPKHKVGSMLPTTRCTNCQTVFELPPELLESTDTRVRCGECLCIFDARDGLIQTDPNAGRDDVRRKQSSRPPKSKSKGGASGKASKNKKGAGIASEASDDNSELDVTYSDFDLFSEEADLPALAYLDETRDTPEFDFDAVELGDEETFSDTLFAHDITIDADLPISESKAAGGLSPGNVSHARSAEVDFTKDSAPEEPLIFNYQDPIDKNQSQEDQAGMSEDSESSSLSGQARDADESNDAQSTDVDDLVAQKGDVQEISVSAELGLDRTKKRRSGVWVWLGGTVLLLAVLSATVVYPRWKSFDQSPTFRPIKQAICERLSCEIDTRVSIADLEVLKREVFESPSREDALLISITIRNRADFAQRYPVVEARMTNRVGRMVAQRAFRPAEYLPQWARGDVLSAGETVDINLTVNDPGNAAEHHVLQLRELRLDCKPVEAPNGSKRWPADCAEL